jgi:hypothetical protein
MPARTPLADFFRILLEPFNHHYRPTGSLVEL